jgi:hypothetical protein
MGDENRNLTWLAVVVARRNRRRRHSSTFVILRPRPAPRDLDVTQRLPAHRA